ncbi:MAG: ABC transporter permease [Terricaulis sp.]
MTSPTLLVARRDYFAYVGAWGFWLSLITAPLLIAVLLFGPVLLAHAEPPRAVVVLADRPADAALVTQAFEADARDRVRAEYLAYLNTAARAWQEPAIAAFDAAPTRETANAALRAYIAGHAPQALQSLPHPSPRYLVLPPPAHSIDGVKPYLDGRAMLPSGGVLYGALNIRRVAGAPSIEYWSVNLSRLEPEVIARDAMRLQMQREALAARGLDPREADRLNGFDPPAEQFDPRPSAGRGQVTLRQRAPFYVALALALILWSVVFSVANMLLSGVIEEKSNKILNSLLTSVTPIQLLVGKLLGVAAVSLTLFLFWGVLGGTLLSAATSRLGDSVLGQIAGAFLDPRLLAAFIAGFFFGYLMYGAVFLALGSICESIQEAQTLLGPIALVLAVPMMLIAPALDNPNAPLIQAVSWVPLFTPFMLLIRAPAGLSWFEIGGMAAVMAVATVIVLVLASRVFSAGVANQISLSNWLGRKPARD